MIHLEVMKGPDENAQGPFQFFQNQLYIGKVSGDLLIRDSELKASHCMLEVIGSELLFHPQSEVEFYLINGKRASQVRKLKALDEVTIGNTTLKIQAFSETKSESKKDILENKLNKLINENSPRLQIIEKLTGRMR
jgi:hypothetical protein